MTDATTPFSPYEPPAIVDYGTLLDLTAGQANGNATDRGFPAPSPNQDLTFSA